MKVINYISIISQGRSSFQGYILTTAMKYVSQCVYAAVQIVHDHNSISSDSSVFSTLTL